MIYKVDWKRARPEIWGERFASLHKDLFEFARIDEQEIGSPYVTFHFRENNKWDKRNLVRTVLDDLVDARIMREVTETSEKAKAFLLGVK
jgi:hypothetical protein